MKTKPGAIIIEGHVQGLGITRSLGEKNIPVIVVDKNNCIARYSKFCKKFFRCPDFKSDEFISFLLEIAEKQNLKGWALFPSNDHIVINLSRNREKLIQYYKVITPGFDIVNKICNKGNLLQLAMSIGLEIPNTYYPENFDLKEYDLDFPVIIKGKEGLNFYKALGVKAFIAGNLEELKNHLSRISKKISLKDLIIQELIPEDENLKVTSFTAFCINGEIKAHWTGEKIREHPIKFGTATFCRSVPTEELLKISTPLLKELNYTGVCEVEYLKDPGDNKYKLIEINARTWLWVSLAIKCGIDYPLMVYNYLNGIEQKYPEEYEISVKWVHFLTDFFFLLYGVLKRKYRISNILQSFRGRKEWAVLSLKDIKPFLNELAVLPHRLVKR